MFQHLLAVILLFACSQSYASHKGGVETSEAEKLIYKKINISLIPLLAVKEGERDPLVRDDAIILDNHHLVTDCEIASLGDFAIAGFKEKPYPTELFYEDPQKLYCIYSINNLELIPVKTRSTQTLKPGEAFYVIIRKEAQVKTFLRGHFIKMIEQDNIPYLQTDIKMNYATVDGLYDGEGNLIGITTDRNSPENNTQGLAVPIDSVMNAITEQTKKEKEKAKLKT